MPATTASVLADSTWEGRRILTMRLEYPRLIHSEYKTYGLLRSNSSSSRAIPVKRMLTITEEVEPYIPEQFVKNGKGMGGTELLDEDSTKIARTLIRDLYRTAETTAKLLDGLGVHKQHVNRYLEPWAMISVIATGSIEGWKHLLWQRNRDDGSVQPEFVKLAKLIDAGINESQSIERTWHVPYLEGDDFPTEQDVLYACGRAARESYKREEVSTDFMARLKDLWEAGHLTPFEHACFWGTTHSGYVALVNPLSVGYAMQVGSPEYYPPDCQHIDSFTYGGWRQVRHIGLGDNLADAMKYAKDIYVRYLHGV